MLYVSFWRQSIQNFIFTDTLEEARKKAGPNYATCDESRRHEKRVIHEKQFDDTLYDTCDDSIDEDCGNLIL